MFFIWFGDYYLCLDCCRDYFITRSFVSHLHVSHMIACPLYFRGWAQDKKSSRTLNIRGREAGSDRRNSPSSLEMSLTCNVLCVSWVFMALGARKSVKPNMVT